VAAKLDVAQISDITKVDSADTFERPIYAGNAIATVQSPTPPRSSPCAPPASTRRPPRRQRRRRNRGRGGRQRQEQLRRRELAKSDRPELTAAKIIVSGGRALGSAEKFNEVMTPLADKLGAAMGASRAAVDAGYAANDCRWARPARSSRRSCTSPAASRAPSSTWPA
jgi:electron transfer flavoprotein alpha subunit